VSDKEKMSQMGDFSRVVFSALSYEFSSVLDTVGRVTDGHLASEYLCHSSQKIQF